MKQSLQNTQITKPKEFHPFLPAMNMRQSTQSSQQNVQSPDTPVFLPSVGNNFSAIQHYAQTWSNLIRTKKPGKKVKINMFMGNDMAQDWPDLLIWEAFFNQYNCKTFIELGTGHGGSALFFALQCYQRGIDFHTFDNVKSFNGNNALLQLMEIDSKFHHVDIFQDGYAIIASLIRDGQHPLAIFFDDGDKPREWRTFAPLTSKGDFCIVHDWGTEFTEKDIGDIPVVRLLGKFSDRRPNGWKAMWFQRI